MNKVLITGASGFIGRHILHFLKNQHFEIHATTIDNQLHTNESKTPVQWHRTNILEKRQNQELISKIKPSHLIHLAWVTDHGKFWDSPENLIWLDASESMYKSFIANGGKRAVFAGTCAEYEWNSQRCSEDKTPEKPSTLYGQTKLALLRKVQHLSKENNISMAWGRIFFLYGPHENKSRLFHYLISSLIMKKRTKCSQGTQIRDFLHVNDVANAFITLLNSNVTGTINIASGIPVQLKDLFEKIADKLDTHSLLDVGSLPIKQNDPDLLVADISRITKTLKWKPKIDLDNGLDLYIKWCEKNIKRNI